MSWPTVQGPWFIWRELALQRQGLSPAEIEAELLEYPGFDIFCGVPTDMAMDSTIGSCKVLEVDCDYFETEAQALAVARMVRAAPAMLDALQAVVRQCGEKLSAASGNDALLGHLEAVITQAGGGAR